MPRDEHPRRSTGGTSDVMGAIFDIVESQDGGPKPDAEPQFRAQALRQLDVPSTLDNLLQLTSRRTWLAIAGIALTIVAGLVYAGNTIQVESVTAEGRAVAPPGIINAASPSAGVITSVVAPKGESVSAGQPVATGRRSSDGSDLAVIAPLPGTVWQQLAAAGAVVSEGTVVTQLLPPGSGSMVMVQVSESSAGPIAVGQDVTLSFGSSGTATGEVVGIDAAPMPSAVANSALAMSTTQSDEPVVMVTVSADTGVPPGDDVRAEIIQSQRTILESVLGIG